MPISPTLLTENEDTADQASYTTASVSPTSGRLVLVAISIGVTSGTAPTISSISGAGLTWTSAAEVLSGDSQRRTAIWQARATSPSPGTLSINLSGTAGNCAWRVVEWSDVSVVRQWKSAQGSGSTKTVALDGGPRAASATFGAFNANTTSDTPSPGTGFTEIGDDTLTNPGSPSTRLFTQWSSTGTNPVEATGGSGATWEVVAIELTDTASNIRTISSTGGNWNSTAAWIEGAVPTSSDDVTALPSSGNLTINVAASARSIDLTGYVGTLTHNAAITLSVGDASGGSYKLASGMTYTLGNSDTSRTDFVATSDNGGAGWPITTAGKTLGTVDFRGAGGKWVLQDAFNQGAVSNMYHEAGTLDTNSQAITGSRYSSFGSTTRTLTLGASTLSLASNLPLSHSGSGLTITTNTATATLTATNADLAGALNWNGLSVVYSNCTSGLIASVTLAALTVTGGSSKTATFTLNGNVTVTGAVALNGNSTINRLLVQSNTVGTSRTLSAGSAIGQNVDFMDIAGAGAASWNLAAISGGAGDAGGNSGITFTTPVTRYARQAGNWSSTSTWSTTSGGAGGASLPLCHDTAVLDANSGTGTITSDMSRACKDLICTGYTGTLGLTTVIGTHNIFGSITFSSGMTLTQNQQLHVWGRGSHTLTLAGKSLGQTLNIQGPGTYTLQDALTSTSSVTQTRGTFVTNNQTVTATIFVSNSGNTRTLTLGSSTINLTLSSTGTIWNLSSAGLTLNATSSNISIASSSNARTFAGGGLTYGTLTYAAPGATGALSISGSNTFETISVDEGQTLRLTNGTTTTVTNWDVAGVSGSQTTLNSTSPGNQATLTKAGGGQVVAPYLTVQDIAGTPTNTWHADPGGVNNGNNTGWTFGQPSFPLEVTDAGGIASDEQVPAPLVTPTVTPSSIPTGEAVGQPELSLTVVAGSIASAEVVSAPTLRIAVQPVAIPSQESFPTPQVNTIIRPAAKTSEEAWGTATFLMTVVGAGGIATQEAVGTPRQSNPLYPAGIVSAEAAGSPQLKFFLQPQSVVSGEIVGSVVIAFQVLVPPGMDTVDAFGETEVVPGPLYRSVEAIPGEAKTGTPLVKQLDWWSASYLYRRRIVVTAPTTEALPSGHPVVALLSVEQERRQDYVELEMFSYVPDRLPALLRIGRELTATIDGFEVRFLTDELIPPGGSGAFFVYYGSGVASDRPLFVDNPWPVALDNTNEAIAYTRPSEHWRHGVALVEGARATLQFTGSAVRIVGNVGPSQAIAEVQLDDGDWVEVDLFDEVAQEAEVFKLEFLPPGVHRIRYRSSGRANPSAITGRINLSRIEYLVPITLSVSGEEVNNRR